MDTRPARRSHRLQGYDYSVAGAYFVTICAQDRLPLFGEVVNGQLNHSEAGLIVKRGWQALPERFPDAIVDDYVVMPNHLHAIVMLIGPRYASGGETPPLQPRRTLGQLIGFFKYQTTKAINELHGTPGRHLWQRNYYDHIIRNEHDLDRIREYIALNPGRWEEDRENPANRACRGGVSPPGR